MTGRSGRRAAVTLAAAFLARGVPLAAEDAGALLASGLEPPRAEAAARARLAEVERRPDPGSLADALDLLAGAIASNWSVAPDAREIGERALAARKAVATPDDPKLATSLSNLARICRKLDDAACERDLHERALAIRERSLGRDHPLTAESLVFVATSLESRDGAFEAADPLLARALAIVDAHGGNDRRLAIVLRFLGDSKARRGETDRAIAHYRRCLDMPLGVLPALHPDRGICANNLGNALWTRGDTRAAAEKLREGYEVWEAAFGPDHPATAAAMTNVARGLAFVEGDIAGALALERRAVSIVEKAYGPDASLVGEYLAVLAGTLAATKDFPAAIDAFERCIAIADRTSGPSGDASAHSRMTLGIVHLQMGDFASAERLFESARRDLESNHGPDHPWSWYTRLNLAQATLARGDLERACERFEEAAGSAARAGFGPDHPHLAYALHGAADCAWRLEGDADRASALHERGLRLREAAVGPASDDVAESLESIAAFLREAGRTAEARKAYERALAIREARQDRRGPVTAATRVALAETVAAAGDPRLALTLALDGEAAYREHVRLVARGLSEDQTLHYAARRPSGLDLSLALLASRTELRGRAGEVLDQIVRSRAVILDEMARRRHAAREAASPDVAAAQEAYRAATTRLANLLVRGAAGLSPEEFRTLVDRAREGRGAAERSLARVSGSFRVRLAADGAGLEEVRRALAPKGVLVAIARYDRSAAPHSDGSRPAAPRPAYAAFVATADAGARFVDLGDAIAIDTLVYRFRAEVSRRPRRDDEREAWESFRAAGRDLRAAIWEPISKEIGGASEITVVPDGVLHLVNLSTLPDAASGLLVETGPRIRVVSAERDLVEAGPGERGRGLLAVGGVDFDRGVTRPAASPSVTRGAPIDCRGFEGMRFEALPASGREVEAIAASWASRRGRKGDVRMLRGAEASETAFKTLAPGRESIHLATHGVFLGSVCGASAPVGPGGRGVGVLAGDPEQGAKWVESPLRLSALAFAGANLRDRAAPDADDGILTAEEVATLDLSSVDWAVLSACATGVGDVQAGEGVLGLRRAFRIAGAKTLVASLWAVDDRATTEWMAAAYRARLRTNSSAEAVRAASLEVIRSMRAEGRPPHPFYWGAFVATSGWEGDSRRGETP